MPAREEPVEEERAHASDVEEACRARCHADADGHDRSIVGTRWNSARTSRLRAESTPRSTASRRSAATACRCSRRARACGARRTHTPEAIERFRARARRGGHRRRRRATRSTSATSPAPNDVIYEKSIAGAAHDGRRSLRDRGGRRHLPRRLASRRRLRGRPRAHDRGARADPRALRRRHLAADGELGRLGRHDRPLARASSRRSSSGSTAIRGSASASTRATSTPPATT